MKLRCDYDRRLEASNSYESAELPSSDDFALDGTSSDLARQLYLRAKAGGQVEQLDSFTLPVAVQTRLDELKLEWGSLPGVAQRALLWDSGFVVSLSNQAVQIWPLSGHSMTNLAVPLVDFHAVGCEEKNCTQPDNTTSSSNHYCSGVKMVAAARCVVDDFDDSSNPNTAMWEIGGDPDAVPAPWITKHTWRDYSTGDSYKVPAIHTMDLNDEPSYNTCAASDQNGGYGSLVFPCYLTSNASDTIKSEKQQVNGSAWVSQWLVEDYAVSSHDAINVSLIIAIICGIIFIALVVLLVVIKRRRKKHASSTALAETDTCAGNNRQGSSPRDSGGDRSTVPTLEDNDIVPDRIVGKTSSIAPAYQELNSEWNFTLKTLLGSKFLVGKCIPYESVKFERAISKGAHGEVWLGEYQGQQVAVKRLLQTKTHQAYEVEEFAKEIELSASLAHPNVVSFVGVAWNSLSNLVMVLEFFPTGDLQRFLRDNFDSLSWSKELLHIAVDVVRGLEYLHSRAPPLIHRDLKSKNILLTTSLDAKLIDFGVSRDCQELSMTAGVGTPYWTAPEILEGKRYTEKADIYSFGVVLSELDTGKLPYHDILTPEGQQHKPIQVLTDVMEGKLRPSFSQKCPSRIRRIGSACCRLVSTQRPTASEVLKMLQDPE